VRISWCRVKKGGFKNRDAGLISFFQIGWHVPRYWLACGFICDVSSSCWKRHLEHLYRDGWRISRLQWETAQSRLHSGAMRIPVWMTLPAIHDTVDGMTFTAPAADLRIKYDREHFQQIMTRHPLPRRWRLRHNDRLRLLCDASAFIAALARLHQPERGGFLRFSQAA
jgi:hypothetical protein